MKVGGLKEEEPVFEESAIPVVELAIEPIEALLPARVELSLRVIFGWLRPDGNRVRWAFFLDVFSL